MSSRTKFVISTLFIVVIVLCVGLTKFYLDATKDSGNAGKNPEIRSVVRQCENGMMVFESENGFCGVLNSDGDVIIEPEWMEVLDVGSRIVVVSRRMNNQVLIGGIDYEENVVLPFAYRSMEFFPGGGCIAKAARDESCVIFDAEFRPLFQSSWESASCTDGMLELKRNGCTFVYDSKETPVSFRRANMQCSFGETELLWNVTNKTYLSELTAEDLLTINHAVSAYMDMLVTNDFSGLEEISGNDYMMGLSIHDSFKGYAVTEVRDFSFSYDDPSERNGYVFSFSVQCRPVGTQALQKKENGSALPSGEQDARINLRFFRSSANTLILISAGIDFQASESATENTVRTDEE